MFDGVRALSSGWYWIKLKNMMKIPKICHLVVAAIFLNPAAPRAGEFAPTGSIPAFYKWSDDIPSVPGRLLRTEPLTPEQRLSKAGSSVRLLYASTDGVDGHTPVVVSGALYLPKGHPPPGGWPLIAWAHGTVGTADICAPSYAGRSPRDRDYLDHWLDSGYAIVATDYPGLGTGGVHPYAGTRSLAYSVLDSVRAVAGPGFHISKKTVIVGQSQGARAAFASALYAASYSPNLDIAGVVATGTPDYLWDANEGASDDTLATSRKNVNTAFAFDLYQLQSARLLNAAYRPENYLNEQGLKIFKFAENHCVLDLQSEIVRTKTTFDGSFKTDPKDVFSAISGLGAYPEIKTNIPIFLGTGGKDRAVSVPGQIALAKRACAAGNRVEFHFYPDLDHSGAVLGSTPDSTIFVRKAFSGAAISGNCATAKLTEPSQRVNE
jgi:acetyl esterase/lipase